MEHIISTKSDMSPLFTYKGLVYRENDNKRDAVNPIQILRDKLNSKRTKLQAKKLYFTLPEDLFHQLRMDKAEKEYVIAKCKALLTGLY